MTHDQVLREVLGNAYCGMPPEGRVLSEGMKERLAAIVKLYNGKFPDESADYLSFNGFSYTKAEFMAALEAK